MNMAPTMIPDTEAEAQKLTIDNTEAVKAVLSELNTLVGPEHSQDQAQLLGVVATFKAKCDSQEWTTLAEADKTQVIQKFLMDIAALSEQSPSGIKGIMGVLKKSAYLKSLAIDPQIFKDAFAAASSKINTQSAVYLNSYVTNLLDL